MIEGRTSIINYNAIKFYSFKVNNFLKKKKKKKIIQEIIISHNWVNFLKIYPSMYWWKWLKKLTKNFFWVQFKEQWLKLVKFLVIFREFLTQSLQSENWDSENESQVTTGMEFMLWTVPNFNIFHPLMRRLWVRTV